MSDVLLTDVVDDVATVTLNRPDSRNALWEIYLTEPSPDMDPADLRTELNWTVS